MQIVQLWLHCPPWQRIQVGSVRQERIDGQDIRHPIFERNRIGLGQEWIASVDGENILQVAARLKEVGNALVLICASSRHASPGLGEWLCKIFAFCAFAFERGIVGLRPVRVGKALDANIIILRRDLVVTIVFQNRRPYLPRIISRFAWQLLEAQHP